jgi:hypothetical protein
MVTILLYRCLVIDENGGLIGLTLAVWEICF